VKTMQQGMTDQTLNEQIRLGWEAWDYESGIAFLDRLLRDPRTPPQLQSLAAFVLELTELRHREKAKFNASKGGEKDA